ncbi:hypothetical protein [Pseudoxanthomonas sp.]|uniref:hypothetical protein n=1 Tax=Pseudoxanthomonas sp. TaxID=1871049 RepID=UPI00261262C8|nr:hypothetical protein [Pseudoxanthomonas sp.]WDS36202.1 MAG: hypothetical protein O8I58_18355 [Pseudoxanthomonas sp.]
MSSHTGELNKIKQAAADFLPANAFIAGGALTSVFTGQPINDVDLYFKTREAFIAAIRLAYESRLWCVFATDRAVTFKRGDDTIQLMHFDFFESAAAVFDAFDFTVCMGAYDIDADAFVFHPDFLKHASQRYLKFHSGTRFPFGSLLRVMKYQARGYTLGKGDLLRIALCCHQVRLESWEDLAAAIGGQYGERVALDTEAPFSVAAAVALIANTEFTVAVAPDDMPGNAEELLVKIGLIKQPKDELL